MSFTSSHAAIDKAACSEGQLVFSKQMNQISAIRGRDYVESETGFTVFGSVRTAIAGGSWVASVFHASQDVAHIKVIPKGVIEGRSLLIEFESGIGIVLAIKLGFIGTVLLEKGQVVNVNYTPSSQSSMFGEEYENEIDRIERRRAFAATATRHGVFQLVSHDAEHPGDYLRMTKRIDPTLGIYAAYAYNQAGRIKSIRSMVKHMTGEGPIPFDVLLLARYPEPWPTFAPFCPMLRQGWALLPLHPPAVGQLGRLQQLLLPSLWATFAEEGVRRVHDSLENGDFV